MVDRSHLVKVGLAIGLAIALSASIGTTAGEPDPDKLVEMAVDSLENESLEAVHTQQISRPGGEVTQTIVVEQRSSGSGYLEVIDTTAESGQQLVFNGSTVIQQRIGDDTAVKYEQPSEYIFEEFMTVGATPEQAVDYYQGEYKGTAEVDGRESHLVELTSPKTRTAALSLDIDAGDVEYELPIHETTEEQWYLSQETWWIDKETYYPIKQSVEWKDEDGNVIATATRTSEQLAVGSEVVTDDIDPESGETVRADFELDTSAPEIEESSDEAPTDASAESSAVESDVFETRHAANAAVPFDLPHIDRPTGYTYEQSIVHTHEEKHSVILLYGDDQTGATLSVRIVEGESSLFQRSTVLHSEEITAFDGSIVVTDTGTEVVRECDDITYQVRGPPDAETLIQVTESIEC